MYLPLAFREDRLDVQHGLIRAHPLATLLAVGPDGVPHADHVPFLLADIGPFGTLQGHVARPNASARETAAIAVFHGPVSYVSPGFYPSKREHGRVVPTWNYAVVHAHGRLRVVDDEDWLHAQIDALTRHMEGHRAEPWAVTDAPAPFVAGQVRGIVGVELAIERIEAKWKVSQNRPEPDRQGVATELAADPATVPMARLVAQRG